MYVIRTTYKYSYCRLPFVQPYKVQVLVRWQGASTDVRGCTVVSGFLVRLRYNPCTMGNNRGDGDDGGERRSRRRGAASVAAAATAGAAPCAAATGAASSSVTKAAAAKMWRWEVHYRRLVAFKKTSGHCRVPARYVEDAPLGRWVRNQPRRYKRHRSEKINAVSASPGDGATQPEWIRRLEAIGFEWDGRAAKEAELWDQWYRMLKAFKRRHGHCRVLQRCLHGGKRLGRWVSRQRQSYKQGASALPGDGATHRERIRRLNEIGFAWDGRPTNEAKRGEEPSEKLQTYRAERGNCHAPRDCVHRPGPTAPAAATASTSSSGCGSAAPQRSITRTTAPVGAAARDSGGARSASPASSGYGGTIRRANACPVPAVLTAIAPPLRKRARREIDLPRLGRQDIPSNVRRTHESEKRLRSDVASLPTTSHDREKLSGDVTGSVCATCPVLDDEANEAPIPVHDGVGDAMVPDESPTVQRKRRNHEGARRSSRLLGSAEKRVDEPPRSGEAAASFDSPEGPTDTPTFTTEGDRSSSGQQRLRSDRLANEASNSVSCTEKASGGGSVAKRVREVF
jgi:Helicase associated domain